MYCSDTKITLIRALIALIIATPSARAVSAAEWYKEAPAVQDDIYGFASTFSGAFSNLFSKGFRVEGSLSSGKFYAVFSQAEYDRIWNLGNSGEEWATHTITADEAPGFRKFFAEKGTGLKLPLWFTLGSGVIGLSKRSPLVATAATVASIASELMNAGEKAYLNSATDIAAKINPGDRFVRRVAIEVRAGNPYAHMTDSLVLNTSKGNVELLLHRLVVAVKIDR